MSSSKVREIPIFREADQRKSHSTPERTASPANCPPTREIPIQRDSGIGGRPFDDFFSRQSRGFGGPWPNHRTSRNSDMFDSEPFSYSPGIHSRSGFSGLPSHVGNDFWGDRRSPLQRPFSGQREDCSSPHRTGSPVTTSQPPQPQQPTEAEASPVPPPEKPKQTFSVFVEPAASDAAPSSNQTEPKNDVADAASLHVEEPPRRARSPSPAPPNMTPLEIIEQVQEEGARLKGEVLLYTGGRKEKPYLRLEEMLTRLLIKLDRIESEGRMDIRNARREAVHTIQSVLELLESRASETATKDLSTNQPSAVPENSSDDATVASDSASETTMETSSTNDNLKDAEETKQNVDAAAVKEMVLGSEVPC